MNTAAQQAERDTTQHSTTLLVDEQRDRVLLALADPTRRAILDLLVQGDARVTELARPFAISLNSVSKHIRMLERADLVQRRRSGREHIIALNPEALDETAQWMNAQRDAWRGRLAALDRMLQEQDAQAAAETAGRGNTLQADTHTDEAS